MTDRNLISIVIPCYNEEQVFPLLREALVKVADKIDEKYRSEIVLVDDGSRDSTWDLIQSFAAEDDRIRGMSFARNFGHQAALTCGYDMASGDAIVCMDADLQDPPEVILDMIEKWEEGADVVLAVRRNREGETRFKLWTAAIFYRMIRLMGAKEVRANSGDFRLMSRRALDALNKMREKHRFIRGMVGWVGFNTAEVQYDRKARAAGETKYPLSKMIRLAFDATVSFSSFPLRLTFVFAALLAMFIFCFLAYAGLNWLFFDKATEPGWTSIILAVSGFGLANLICLGILGEYVGRLYEQSKQRPLYLVQEDTVGAQPSRGGHGPPPTRLHNVETSDKPNDAAEAEPEKDTPVASDGDQAAQGAGDD